MAYLLAIRLRCQDGSAETFASVLADIAPGSRAEPGNIRFEVAQSIDDPNTFVVVESYVDEAAYGEHLRTPGFGRVKNELFPLLVDREQHTCMTLGD